MAVAPFFAEFLMNNIISKLSVICNPFRVTNCNNCYPNPLSKVVEILRNGMYYAVSISFPPFLCKSLAKLGKPLLSRSPCGKMEQTIKKGGSPCVNPNAP